ncbi:hypothetical protein POM88_042343 [Heracleum sosnowskyi]|uniref:Uncharacterized protein n=1 Tax=Heracleum sosnowskyi TaxID=360622 RepID=A0AAD8MBJ1_9APIA|nr:hypothetical protein POM88_042343 [Heracleum sosnowskyi]
MLAFSTYKHMVTRTPSVMSQDNDIVIQSITEFIQMEAVEPQLSSSDNTSLDGRMAVISTRTAQPGSSLIVSSQESSSSSNSIKSSKSLTLQSLRSAYVDENPRSKNIKSGFSFRQLLD